MLAVCDGTSRRSVLFCTVPAGRQGVCSAMPVAAARALVHDLIVHPRDLRAENRALHALAAWAYQFSSQVSVYPPCTVLLEVQGSLKLFGGYSVLLERIQQGIEALGYKAQIATAPTPLAAYSLACCNHQQYIEDAADLAAALADLPLSVLDWTQPLLDRLHGMGVRRLGEVLKLPRDGLARRFGPDKLLYLDRMLGRCPDPQTMYKPPARFRRRLQLVAEVEQTDAMLFVLQRLVMELCGWLHGQGGALQHFEIRLWHRCQQHTRLTIGLHEKSRAADQFMVLVRERLERLELEQPVQEIELRADQLLQLDAQSLDLFDTHVRSNQVDLLDRLRARLGSDAIRGLSAVAEHRPEYAWSYSEPGHSEQCSDDRQRPLWLLPVPRQLRTDNNWPCLQGRLTLQQSRERIESGWWDERDIARDYFIARSTSGACYWIYHELSGEQRWFLQGIFE